MFFRKILIILPWILFPIIRETAMSADMRSFENFKAPYVTGAFNAPWNPIGMTDNGFMFSIGFYLKNDDETRPTILWLGKNASKVIEIRSVGSINAVASQMFLNQDVHQNLNAAIDTLCQLVATPLAAYGQTGFALDMQLNPAVEEFIRALRSQGLEMKTQSRLESYLREENSEVNRAAGQWRRWWYEVDSVGAISRVTVRGLIEPLKVTGISSEIIADAEEVPSRMLRVEKLKGSEPAKAR